jgi:hypothetical protein
LNFVQQDSVAAQLFKDQLTVQEEGKIDQLKGKENKKIKAFYTNRLERMNYMVENESVVFDQKIYPKLNEILEYIKKSNPEYSLSNANRVLVGNSLAINAVCYGNEVLVVYLGLLARCENESQIAFVIAHELSHQILDHVDNTVRENIAHQESRKIYENSKEYKEIEDYNRRSSNNLYLNEYGFKVRAESRKKESQADSLAYILLKNTTYNRNDAIRFLRILDQSDQEKYKIALNLESILGGTNQEFNPAWLKTKEGLNVEQEFDKEILDSLKTHPDCDSRIAKLMQDFTILPIDTVSVIEEIDYLHNIDFELIKFDLVVKRYARALKNSLLQKQLHPSNVELNKIIAICLGNIYMATKDHTLFDYVPKPNDNYNFNYHQILLLIENIRLSELGGLFEDYYKNNVLLIARSNRDEHRYYLEYLHAAIAQDGDEEQLKKEYQSKFPKGIYF